MSGRLDSRCRSGVANPRQLQRPVPSIHQSEPASIKRRGSSANPLGHHNPNLEEDSADSFRK